MHQMSTRDYRSQLLGSYRLRVLGSYRLRVPGANASECLELSLERASFASSASVDVEDNPSADHGHRRLDVLDLIGGHSEVVAIEDDEIGELARLDRAQVV